MSYTTEQSIKFQNAIGDKRKFDINETQIMQYIKSIKKCKDVVAQCPPKFIHKDKEPTYREMLEERDKLFNRTI